MKRVFLLTIVLAILLAVAAGCGGQDPQPAEEIVQEMISFMNSGDIEKSLDYFADDAVVYIVGLPPTGMEVYAGKDQIRRLWQDSIDNHFQWETEITRVDGNLVYVLARTWHDFTRQLEVAPLEYNDVYEVKEGKITTYGTIIAAESLARFKPAFAEIMPPEDPIPSTEQPVSEMLVTIADGTCSLDQSSPLKAGEIQVTWKIDDENKEGYALTLFNLNDEKDLLDLMASTAGNPPSWANILLIKELGPGENRAYTFEVENGPVYMICWSKPPELPIGNAGPIDVK